MATTKTKAIITTTTTYVHILITTSNIYETIQRTSDLELKWKQQTG